MRASVAKGSTPLTKPPPSRWFDLTGGQSSFIILVNSRLTATNYTDDLLEESAELGQETHFQFQA
jgi:hypothetical protein